MGAKRPDSLVVTHLINSGYILITGSFKKFNLNSIDRTIFFVTPLTLGDNGINWCLYTLVKPAKSYYRKPSLQRVKETRGYTR